MMRQQRLYDDESVELEHRHCSLWHVLQLNALVPATVSNRTVHCVLEWAATCTYIIGVNITCGMGPGLIANTHHLRQKHYTLVIPWPGTSLKSGDQQRSHIYGTSYMAKS